MPIYPHSLPELLAPAGSPEALEAAFSAGADAVYLGGSRFNARLNAHNFDPAELREAVTHAHRMGGRVYLTLNTLVWDRELPDALEAAYEAATAGVDALIIADVGAAALIHRALPARDDDCPLVDRQGLVRDHQIEVKLHLVAEARADRAGSERIVK